MWILSWGTGISVTHPTVTAVYPDLAAIKILNKALYGFQGADGNSPTEPIDCVKY